MTTESSTLTTSDGFPLAMTVWTPATDPRGVIVVVHGYGEHSGRYQLVAEFLCGAGFRVVAFDQRGHGLSGGVPAFVSSFEEYLADLDLVLGHRAAQGGPKVPIVLWGQSMGGLAVVRHLQTRPGAVSGAIVSAPWLATKRATPWWKVAFGRVLKTVAPAARVSVVLDPESLTSDVERQRAYLADPLIHKFVTPGLYWAVAEAQRRALADAGRVRGPALFLVPESDEVVDSGITIEFVKRVSAPGVEMCRLKGLRHEPHNEPDRGDVFARVRNWLDHHFSDESEA